MQATGRIPDVTLYVDPKSRINSGNISYHIPFQHAFSIFFRVITIGFAVSLKELAAIKTSCRKKENFLVDYLRSHISVFVLCSD